MKNCEDCGSRGIMATTGPFAGSYSGVLYCVHCSKDLCDDCLEIKHCRESVDGKHQADWCEKCETALDECDCKPGGEV